MAVRYEFAFDLATFSDGFAMTGTDDGGAFSVSMTSGTYAHATITSVVSGYTAFSAALKTALDAASASGTYTVTYAATTGYTIAYSGALCTLDLTGTTAQTNMARLLGFSGDRSGATSYASQVRPYYLILPSMPGRSEMTDEYEPDGIVFESQSDDGTRYQMAVDTSEVLSDWTQMAETNSAPDSAFADGTFVFERSVNSAAPWSYQHAWEHARKGKHPFLCVDSGTSESAVHLLRAEGGSFRPQRMASKDYSLWNIPFKTALLGRL